MNKRPLSPHLSIYKPQISSILSIGHRISGFVLFIGLLAIMWWIILMPYITNPDILLGYFTSPLGKGIAIAWSYSLFFHFCTGIRHLIWDSGHGFSLRVMKIGGVIAVLSSITLTAISWVIALGVKI